MTPEKGYYRDLCYTTPERPIAELMLMQSKGQHLTRDEKNRVTLHAEQKRKQRFYN